MNVIFGAGGFAKEVSWLINDWVRADNDRRGVDAFVADDAAPNIGSCIHNIKVIGESEFFDSYGNSPTNIFIAVGSPNLRQKLYEKCVTKLSNVAFPTLLHPSVIHDSRPAAVSVELGSIVCAGSVLTTDLHIGKLVHVNLNCTIGHDVEIGSFSTLSPGAHISGHVHMGRNCFIGTGAVVLENVHIPDFSVIGAGATVTKTLDVAGTYVGTPARLRP